MTAATITRQALKDRLQDVLDYAAYGASDPDGCTGDCGDEECIQRDADQGTLTAAFRAIDQAPTEEAALAVYVECWLALAGIPAPEWSVQVVPGGGETR